MSLFHFILKPVGNLAQEMIAGVTSRNAVVAVGEGIAHLEMVAHAKAVHHLTLRIVLLREDVIVTIGLEESLHIIILCLVGHEKHVLVAKIHTDIMGSDHCPVEVDLAL